MNQFNIQNTLDLEANYESGLLPQRTAKGLFYRDSSCRSRLQNFSLSSENRRILRKTENYTYCWQSLADFNFDHSIQKQVIGWTKALKWDFPANSVKTVFKHHIFNHIIIWKDSRGLVIAYALVLLTSGISHIAYLFYDPAVSHQDILIRIVLQFVIDSRQRGVKYAYLGRFSPDVGYYKRNMPGFEYYNGTQWTQFT